MPGITMGGLQLERVATVDASGQAGVVNTSDTTAVAGSFSALQCLADTVFASITEPGATGSLAGISLSAGTVLFGAFTGYQLTSGVVRAHKA